MHLITSTTRQLKSIHQNIYSVIQSHALVWLFVFWYRCSCYCCRCALTGIVKEKEKAQQIEEINLFTIQLTIQENNNILLLFKCIILQAPFQHNLLVRLLVIINFSPIILSCVIFQLCFPRILNNRTEQYIIFRHFYYCHRLQGCQRWQQQQ